MNEIIHGDSIAQMRRLPDKSINLILCDLPYGVTKNSWDILIPMEPLWEQYRRIIADNGVIALTSQGIFTAKLMIAGEDIFRYTLVWEKNKTRGFYNVKKQPLRKHEDVLIFYKSPPIYNPQKTKNHPPVHSYTKHAGDTSTNYGKSNPGFSGGGSTERYPTSIIQIPVVNEINERYHPTQKPVELGEWFVKTYTNENDVVLDNACGSGSFLIAAKKLNRRFIGIDSDLKYCETARKRLAAIPDPCATQIPR